MRKSLQNDKHDEGPGPLNTKEHPRRYGRLASESSQPPAERAREERESQEDQVMDS